MTYQRMIELLEIEHECMLRKSHDVCDGNCCVCELVQDDYELHEMYINVISTLKAQEPRVMTLEDMWALKFNDTIIIEQNITPLLFPAIVIDNIKHDCNLEVLQVVTAAMNGIANADYDYYGKRWRCWTSRPTDEVRMATPWE